MASTNDDMLVERLVPKVLSSIRAKAKPVETIPVAEDLSGITSLPAYDTTGEQFKAVLVPLNALKEPAMTEGQKAAESAEKATAAAIAANQAAADAQAAAAAANEFADKIVLLPEEVYDEMLNASTLDETKLYFAHE